MISSCPASLVGLMALLQSRGWCPFDSSGEMFDQHCVDASRVCSIVSDVLDDGVAELLHRERRYCMLELVVVVHVLVLVFVFACLRR